MVRIRDRAGEPVVGRARRVMDLAGGGADRSNAMTQRTLGREAALSAGFVAACVLAGCSLGGPPISSGEPPATYGKPLEVAPGGWFASETRGSGKAMGMGSASVEGPVDAADMNPVEQIAAAKVGASPVIDPAAIPSLWDAGAISMGVGFGAGDGADGARSSENAQPVSFGAEGSDFDPCISADGGTVVFASTRHSNTADIYRKSVGGTAVVQLTNDPAHDVMPAISPDGTRVAFASDRDGSWDIFVVSVDGGPSVQVTDGVSSDLHPSWSPDGTTLAFCRMSAIGQTWEVWTVEVDRPATTRFLTDGLFPVWQPNGNKIAFQRSRNRGTGQFSLWTVDVINGEAHRPTEVVASPKGAVINPAWSHDGTRLAFSTVLHEHQTGETGEPTQADLWVQGLDGAGRVNLTRGTSVNLMPAWGPDGSVYFVTDRSGRESIWAVPGVGPVSPGAVASEPVPVDAR